MFYGCLWIRKKKKMPGARSVEKMQEQSQTHKFLSAVSAIWEWAVKKGKCVITFLAWDCFGAQWHLLQVLCLPVNPNQDLFILSADGKVDKSGALSFFSGWIQSINFFICMYGEQQVAYPAFTCSLEYSTHCAASQTFIPTLYSWSIERHAVKGKRPLSPLTAAVSCCSHSLITLICSLATKVQRIVAGRAHDLFSEDELQSSSRDSVPCSKTGLNVSNLWHQRRFEKKKTV